jgi:hypothetical protein
MSDAPIVDSDPSESNLPNYLEMIELAEALRQERNKAYAIIAAAKDYVEEFKEFWPEDTTLIAILEGRMPSINKKEISKT